MPADYADRGTVDSKNAYRRLRRPLFSLRSFWTPRVAHFLDARVTGLTFLWIVNRGLLFKIAASVGERIQYSFGNFREKQPRICHRPVVVITSPLIL